jgi:ABC-type antimicrobial peptide transport system permease subunit
VLTVRPGHRSYPLCRVSWLAFGMVLLIAAISGYIGVRRVLKIEPFDIFRG